MKYVTRVGVLSLLMLMSFFVQAEKNARHHDFPSTVAGFHDAMAPLWHSESGEKRNQQICKQYPELVSRLDKVRSDKAPEDVSADKWKRAVNNMYKVLTPIEAICADGRTPEYAFANVHYGFHELVKLIGHEH